MKKQILTLLSLLAALILLTACTSGSLPAGMDEQTAETRAKEIITAMAGGDFEQVVALYGNDALAEKGVTPPTAEDWETSATAMEAQLKLGAFQQFTSTHFQTIQDDVFGECGVVVVGCQYENQTVAWQVVFNPDMDIVGLWV